MQQSIQYLLLSSLLCRQRHETIKRLPLITTIIVARVYKWQSNDPLLSGPFTWCYWQSCAVPDADVVSLILTRFTNIQVGLLTLNMMLQTLTLYEQTLVWAFQFLQGIQASQTQQFYYTVTLKATCFNYWVIIRPSGEQIPCINTYSALWDHKSLQ
jgi:hypothetical protein